MRMKRIAILLSFVASLAFAASLILSRPLPLAAQGSQLAAPTGLTLAASSDSVTINWNAVSGASSYNLAWWHNRTDSWQFITGITETSITHSGRLGGHIYWYSVQGVDAEGQVGLWATKQKVTTTPPLPKPTNVRLTLEPGSIRINWNAVSGAHQYTVWWKEESGYWYHLTTTRYLAATHSGLTGGKEYTYALTGMTARGDYGYWSTWEKARALPPSLPAPQSLTVSRTLDNVSIRIVWDGVHGADYYKLRKRANSNSDSDWRLTSVAATSFIHGGLSSGVRYEYSVAAVDSHGNMGAWSSSKSLTLPTPTPTPTLTPTPTHTPTAIPLPVCPKMTLSVEDVGDGIGLRWNGAICPIGAARVTFELQRADLGSSNFVTINSSTPTIPTRDTIAGYVDADVTPGAWYKYRVRGVSRQSGASLTPQHKEYGDWSNIRYRRAPLIQNPPRDFVGDAENWLGKFVLDSNVLSQLVSEIRRIISRR